MIKIATVLFTLFVMYMLSGWDFEDEVTTAAYKCDALGGKWDVANLNCEGVTNAL